VPASDSVPAPRLSGPIGWVFLDRDGTLNVKAPEGEYIERPEELELLPGAAEAVAILNRAGIWTGVVTNQRGVALGRMSAADVDRVHVRLRELLAHGGAHLDAIYTCPHGNGECTCRKPQPGLLLAAARETPGLDFGRSAIVGDSPSDVQAGRALGLRTVLLADDPGDPRQPPLADHLARDLLEAVRLLTAAALEPRPQTARGSGGNGSSA
jgi:D-glycero-D-manno-heptose 1,7-bisphosphate phosphatase